MESLIRKNETNTVKLSIPPIPALKLLGILRKLYQKVKLNITAEAHYRRIIRNMRSLITQGVNEFTFVSHFDICEQLSLGEETGMTLLKLVTDFPGYHSSSCVGTVWEEKAIKRAVRYWEAKDGWTSIPFATNRKSNNNYDSDDSSSDEPIDQRVAIIAAGVTKEDTTEFLSHRVEAAFETFNLKGETNIHCILGNKAQFTEIKPGHYKWRHRQDYEINYNWFKLFAERANNYISNLNKDNNNDYNSKQTENNNNSSDIIINSNNGTYAPCP